MTGVPFARQYDRGRCLLQLRTDLKVISLLWHFYFALSTITSAVTVALDSDNI
ncbi:hypothetical protein EV356DRAFT_510233 [Viridothelium virens]|uniref:Uncharacterized protein n=1 Tax=Viridothelium virens TaxID=1048519 RepID=A0A6A6GVZ4_VIRVR|nr:hypothetical protein EV356DRAFT_510233 [Viridothelium virens]